MSAQGKVKKRIFPVLFMLAVTLVFISVTTVIYTLTQDAIKINETLVLKRAVLAGAGFSVPSSVSEIESIYQKAVSEARDSQDKILYYIITQPDSLDLKGYVIVTTGSGLWGEITAAIGISNDLKTITGIDIIDQNETPGLGGRITEVWFKNQFKDKKGPLTTVPEGEPVGDNEFQAITGASYSSNAIKVIINETLQNAKNLIKS
jgi:Na+-transporting NADH:ubiquinone oxidoreductase subunit C